MFFPHVYTPMVEVIKTKENKINDIKAKSKDIIVTQKLIEVLNLFCLSSSRQPSLNIYRLCDLTGLHCVIAVFLKQDYLNNLIIMMMILVILSSSL